MALNFMEGFEKVLKVMSVWDVYVKIFLLLFHQTSLELWPSQLKGDFNAMSLG